MRTWRGWLPFDTAIEDKRTAIGMPEPVDRVNENPERRGLKPLRAHGPTLERRMRPVEGIDRAGTELRSQRIDNLLRPKIQRVRSDWAGSMMHREAPRPSVMGYQSL